MKKSTKHLFSTLLYFIGIILVLLLLVYTITLPHAEAKGSKVGVGNFVMAVSYTESYDDLQYVANFVSCEHAQAYYDSNCIGAYIMMCQLEEYLYMPIGHKSDSSFDFEPTEGRSCGFVGVDPKFTGVE
jgi:hypothetical protein